MNDNIIKTLFFHNTMFDLKGHTGLNKALYDYLGFLFIYLYVEITTLTYVLMDNISPCLHCQWR